MINTTKPRRGRLTKVEAQAVQACADGLEPKVKRARVCLCCNRTFNSEGAHNRLCTTCRAKSVGPYDIR